MFQKTTGRLPVCLVLLLVVAGLAPALGGGAPVRPIRASEEARRGFSSGERKAPRSRPAPTLIDPAITLPPASIVRLGEWLRDASPASLAAADLDGDGAPELVAGYRSGAAGLVVVAPAQGAERGSAFGNAPAMYDSPASPDFMSTGDFDNDGLVDVVLASRDERALFFLRGDGEGGLRPALTSALPGRVTALVAGEFNRRDGLTDLVVAVTGETGSELLIFEGPVGALRADPDRMPLSEPATGLALGQLDDASPNDLVVSAGNTVSVVHGRDRWLSTDPELRPHPVPPMERHTHDLGLAIDAVALGDFAWEPRRRSEIAVLLRDGTLVLLDHTHAVSPEVPGEFECPDWRRVGGTGIELAGRGPAGVAMIPTRLSRASTDDLIVFDAAGRRAWLLSGALRDQTAQEGFGVERAIPLDGAPVAALSHRLNADAARDLALLYEGDVDPRVHASEAAALLVVNSPADFPVPPPGDGICTLREALLNANTDSDTTAGDCAAGSGLDSISFGIGGGGAPASVVLRGPLPAISDAVILDGNTQGCGTPPCVTLIGTFAGTGTDALTLTGDGSTIRGLVINAFDGDGIAIASNDNVVEGCFIGTDSAGAAAVGNTGAGVSIDNGSQNRIGGSLPGQRNVLSANDTGVIVRGVSTGNRILGNYAGTDASGTLALANVNDGIAIDGSSDNFVGGSTPGEGNLASGNGRVGILVLGGGSGNLIQGNIAGLDAAGQALGNLSSGIGVSDSSGNTIGGTAPGAGNVASSNTFDGIVVTDFFAGVRPTFNIVQGNLAGLDPTGTQARPNGLGGGGIATFPADDTLIGGNVPGARNVAGSDASVCIWIAGNRNVVQGNYAGTDITGTVPLNGLGQATVVVGESPEVLDTVVIDNVIASGNFGSLFLQFVTERTDVRRNLIGTDVTGTVALGSNNAGVQLQGADVRDNTIGSAAPGEGNVIAGHGGAGVSVVAGPSSNVILGNLIGTDATGSPLPNAGPGVRIADSTNNAVGGQSPGAGNTIRFNMGPGVVVVDPNAPATGNTILRNSIDDNAGPGIDLADDGVTPNDAGDPDVGPNLSQNFPLLLGAEVGLGSTTIAATVNSTPATALRVEFFGSPVCDGSSFGEGRRYLGMTNVTTDAAGNATIDTTVLMPATVGEVVSATATGPAGTSEFAECIAAANCAALTPFGQTLLPSAGTSQLVWGGPADVRFAKGPLAGLAAYVTSGGGAAAAATMIDLTPDNPAPGSGLWYLVRPLACGSWQTSSGAEPGRDAGPLP